MVCYKYMCGFLGISLTVLQNLNSDLEEWGGGSALIQLTKESTVGKESRDIKRGQIVHAKWEDFSSRNLGDGRRSGLEMVSGSIGCTRTWKSDQLGRTGVWIQT